MIPTALLYMAPGVRKDGICHFNAGRLLTHFDMLVVSIFHAHRNACILHRCMCLCTCVFIYLFIYFDRVFLCSQGWPGIFSSSVSAYYWNYRDVTHHLLPTSKSHDLPTPHYTATKLREMFKSSLQYQCL